jgi:hypothetical protein
LGEKRSHELRMPIVREEFCNKPGECAEALRRDA